MHLCYQADGECSAPGSVGRRGWAGSLADGGFSSIVDTFPLNPSMSPLYTNTDTHTQTHTNTDTYTDTDTHARTHAHTSYLLIAWVISFFLAALLCQTFQVYQDGRTLSKVGSMSGWAVSSNWLRISLAFFGPCGFTASLLGWRLGRLPEMGPWTSQGGQQDLDVCFWPWTLL